MRPSAVLASFLFCSTAMGVAAAQQATGGNVPAPASSKDVEQADRLVRGFRQPPESARPRIWWHWLSGNVSRQGITKDLEWMRRVGIAGVMMFDGEPGAPQIVPKRITVLSPEWYAHLRHASVETRRLGLEFTMAAAPGWSETGGPWIAPAMAMKKFVWSETRVQGGRPVGMLRDLPAVPGPFQDVARSDNLGREEVARTPFARDVSVIAYRRPDGDLPLSALAPKISASNPALDLSRLIDGEIKGRVLLPAPTADSPTWVRYDFDRPRTMRALTYAGPLTNRFAQGPVGRIEASDDGQTWTSLRTLTGQGHSPAPQRTFAFPATTARHFRIVFERGGGSREPWARAGGIAVAELALVPGARVDLFEDRAGFGVLRNTDALRTPTIDAAAAIPASGVIDLTKKLRPDGTLDWTPPKGEWIILRTGYSLTGEMNRPATPEGTGLEVDKLNAGHVRAHLDAYLGPVLRQTAGPDGKPGLQYLLTDSWEVGQQNWTEAMLAEFKKRRGYDAAPFLPVLAGRVIDSAERSDAFLWDFRRTIADLVAENHYGTITRYAREHGLGYYGEATGAAWPTVADGMQAKSLTDIPMGEFWAMPFGGKPAAFHGVPTDEFPADIIETRSTAHVYGKPLVAAEALTSSLPQWISTPWNLKWVADKYMAMGVNRLVLHTSAHQPDDRAPGLSLAPFGQTFTRHETWAEMAGPWLDYLSRTSFLLQQGIPVSDILYFYGEGAPSGVPYDSVGDPADPRGHGFDYVNADALLRLARVVDGQIVFPGGAAYRVLVLPSDLSHMTLPLITKLRDLVAQGAVIVGPRPTGSPSLSSDSSAVATIADQLWGQTDGHALTMNRHGQGRVYHRADVEGVLSAEGIARDFDYAALDPDMRLEFNHRRLDDGELYFVSNQSDRAGKVTLRFRVTGKAADIWTAENGEHRPVSYQLDGDTTQVPMELAPYQSFFVMFRRPAVGRGETIAPRATRVLATMAGDWQVRFPEASGVQEVIRMPATSWTNSGNADIRFFSGTASYAQRLTVQKDWLQPGARLRLELGRIGDVAEIFVNGKSAGIAWQPPYSVDVTPLLRAGENRIEIKVANTWQNRLVGDLQPGAQPRAFTNPATGIGALLAKKLRSDTPLTPSGLLQPVKLILEHP